MGKLFKIIFFLFTLVLSFSSTGEDRHEIESDSFFQGTAEEQPESLVAVSQPANLFGLLAAPKPVVQSGHTLRVPGSKYYSGSLLVGPETSEWQVQHLNTRYLLRARQICPSLTGSDIIFPFHYFW